MALMQPINGFKAWKIEVESKRKKDPLHTFAILLYSGANKKLSDFVHEHYFTLDDLTGSNFTVFVIWYTLLKDKDGGTAAMAAVSEKFTTYNLVKHFGFNTQKVPCIVFFRDVDATDIIVYRFKDDWEEKELLEEFEKLTDDVTKAREKAKGARNPEEAMWNALEQTIKLRQWITGAVERLKAVKPILEIIQALMGFLPKS